jgi:hypothetical protein
MSQLYQENCTNMPPYRKKHLGKLPKPPSRNTVITTDTVSDATTTNMSNIALLVLLSDEADDSNKSHHDKEVVGTFAPPSEARSKACCHAWKAVVARCVNGHSSIGSNSITIDGYYSQFLARLSFLYALFIWKIR